MALQQAAHMVWASCSLATALLSMAMAQSIPLEFCASVNTADMDPLNSRYQSEGRCFDNCTDLQYALAILQDHNCWCSNYIPHRADQKPLRDCRSSCPGYPDDYCGGDGVFGYLEVPGHAPSGTASPGGNTPEPSPTDDPSSSLVETVTVGGTVRTVTATPQPTGAHDSDLEATTQGGGLGGGAIAGIVIGVIAALAVLAFAIWLFCIKRRRGNDDGVLDSPMRGSGSPATPNKMAELSEGGVFGPGAVGAGAVPRAQTWDSAKRRSHLMPVDPRLDPFAKGIYPGGAGGVAGGVPNASRESFESLQDNQDYSRRVHEPPRVLRAMNPDPVDD